MTNLAITLANPTYLLVWIKKFGALANLECQDSSMRSPTVPKKFHISQDFHWFPVPVDFPQNWDSSGSVMFHIRTLCFLHLLEFILIHKDIYQKLSVNAIKPQIFLQGARNLSKGMAWYEFKVFNPYNIM